MAGDMDNPAQEPDPPPPPQKDGDTITVNVGEDAAHVAAGKNIIQIGSLSIPRWAVLLIVLAVVAIAVLAGVTAYFNQQTSENTSRTAAILGSTPNLMPTPLPFVPAAEGETLIVILPFHNTAAIDSEPHKKIWRAIQGRLQEITGGAVTAAIDPNVVLTADQQAEAERIGKLHNGSMVIWGEDTGVELIASFLNLREPYLDAADVDIHETERAQLANPSRYAEFVTHELPNQMAFLSLFAVGQSYYLDNNYATAIDTINAAVTAAGLTDDERGGVHDLEVAKGLAEAYYRLGWLYQQPPADLGAAIAAYNKAIELDPQDIRAYNNRGIAYLDQGNIQQAFADYNKAIELDPQHSAAYLNRAIAYRVQDDLEQAIADYSKAIELDPQNAAAYNNRGIDYLDHGDFQQAIADFSKAIELHPQSAVAYNNRGNAYRAQGDFQQAIADYSKAIELDPQDISAYNNRGLVYADRGDLQQAIADFNKAIELYPQFAVAYNNLCWTLALYGRAKEAMPTCEKAVALDADPGYIDSRGLAHALLGNYAAAAADFQVYVDWLVENYPVETELIEQRRAWIAALERGENPITPDVLEELKFAVTKLLGDIRQ